MPDRRTVMLSAAALLGGCAMRVPVGGGAAVRNGFVARRGTRLLVDGAPYRYIGTNMWYAPYLGAAAPVGNRDRLNREFDALVGMGVRNVRILASSELSPLRNSVRPAFRDRSATYNEVLLEGLDHALAEMGRRGMRAVLYLTNFWEWSGGMMTYLHWTNGGRYIDMNDPAHPWPEFADMTSGFYGSAQAVAMYHDYVRAVVGRTNAITGRAYRDDPTIMAWQLSNEPRPGGGEAVAKANMPAFLNWVRDTARLIKSIDANHLVSTGSEGLKGCVEDEACVVAEHAPPEIDYLTAHVWPQNWSWVNVADLPGTAVAGEAKVRDYLDRHIAIATKLGKPLVIEEFGYPRDDGSFDPGTPTRWKDRFYSLIFDTVSGNVAQGGPIAGANFWAWGGEGRAEAADHRFRPGSTAYLGDPPHEPQGWFSVFDSDASTREIIATHAMALAKRAI